MGKIVLTKEHTYSGSLILVTSDFSLQKEPEIWEMESVFKETGTGGSSEDMKISTLRQTPGQPDVLLRKEAVMALLRLLADIGCKEEIAAVSGFRTQQEQQEIWNGSIKQNGEAFTRKFVAVPGHSEHQSGYAIDLAENGEEIDFICPEFPNFGIFQKFRERMADFGFVERYVSGKEMITGIGMEPWHFRYVGYLHSVIMADRGIALEEYIGFLREETGWGDPYIFRDGADWIEISCLSLENVQERVLEMPDTAVYQLSGTNEGCAVVSVWRKTA